MSALQLQSAAGLLLLTALAWALGGFRRNVSIRVVVVAIALQLALAAALLNLPPLRAAFALIGDGVNALATATKAGTSLVFGYLGGGPLPFQEPFPGASFILFFQALPLVLVVGALSSVLYHWGVLPAIVKAMAGVLRRLFGLGGATGFGVAANVFVGMVEAPLMIRAWLAKLTRSEMFVVMTAGLATISGNTLVVYALIISPVVPDAAGQLLTASLVSAPAAILAALLMIPPAEGEAATEGGERIPEKLYDSSMDALVRGTQDGLNLLLGIMASLIVFVAIVALINLAVRTAHRLHAPGADGLGVVARGLGDGRAGGRGGDGRRLARREDDRQRVRLLPRPCTLGRGGAVGTLPAHPDLCAVRLHQPRLGRDHGGRHDGHVSGAAAEGHRGPRPAVAGVGHHRLLHDRRGGRGADFALKARQHRAPEEPRP